MKACLILFFIIVELPLCYPFLCKELFISHISFMEEKHVITLLNMGPLCMLKTKEEGEGVKTTLPHPNSQKSFTKKLIFCMKFPPLIFFQKI